MKLKNTIALLVIAIALFAFISFYESHRPSTAQLDWAQNHVAPVEMKNVTGVVITNNEGKIEMHGGETEWMMVAPLKDRANVVLLHDLVAGIEDLAVDQSFEVDGKDGTTLKDYGLENPTLRLKIEGNGAPPEILFGKDTAVEGKTYMRLEGSNRVCVAKNTVKLLVEKKAEDYRDPRLLGFPLEAVSRFDVKSASGEVEVLKDGGEWMVNKPLKARADLQKLGSLLAEVSGMRILGFVPEAGANLASFGLTEPRGTVTFSLEGGQSAVLQIGQPLESDKQKVYAKLSNRESVLILPEKINDLLFAKPNDLRDKHLLKVNMDIVDRIHIEAAGKPPLVIARKEEGWVLKTAGDVPANSVMVKNFVTYLQAQPIIGFVSDVATDLAKYGLDKPQLRVTFSSYASENTAETKAGESAICTIAFGRTDGDIVYARLESEPYIVSYPRNIFEAIFPEPGPWQDVGIYNLNPSDIVSLEVTRDGHTLDLERGQGNLWTVKKAPGTLNQTNVQSLLNALSTLRAVRWGGAETKGLGFEKPSLVITFTTRDSKSGRLTVGSPAADAMWNAEADGRMGAFVLSGPDYDVLHADLLGATAPPPASAPGGGVQ